MRLRPAICFATIAVFLAFMLIVNWPQFGKPPAFAPLSVLSDCSDARIAHVTVRQNGFGPAVVDVLLENGNGQATPGTCNELQVLFPGRTAGGEIFSQQTFYMPGVPMALRKPIDAGVRLTREPGIGDGDSLSLSLTGTPPVPPILRFLWVDARTRTNFSASEMLLPMEPITVDGSTLVPIKHVTLDMVLSNKLELENPTLTPSASETVSLGAVVDHKYDFPTGASVVSLKWTDPVRDLIKAVGVVVLSLLAGAAISDLLTARPQPKASVTSATHVAPNRPPSKTRKRRQ